MLSGKLKSKQKTKLEKLQLAEIEKNIKRHFMKTLLAAFLIPMTFLYTPQLSSSAHDGTTQLFNDFMKHLLKVDTDTGGAQVPVFWSISDF